MRALTVTLLRRSPRHPARPRSDVLQRRFQEGRRRRRGKLGKPVRSPGHGRRGVFKALKRLKMAMGRPWRELARIWIGAASAWGAGAVRLGGPLGLMARGRRKRPTPGQRLGRAGTQSRKGGLKRLKSRASVTLRAAPIPAQCARLTANWTASRSASFQGEAGKSPSASTAMAL